MIISDFSLCHASGAAALALENYNEERLAVPALPPAGAVPPLDRFAEFGLGVAALEGERLVGFLCFYPPWENAFTTTARGTFSPVHAHGAVKEGRELIYRRLYQAAAEKLVRAKIPIHTVALYAHDAEAIRALFVYGFGMRCVDAVRPMEPADGVGPCPGYEFAELDSSRRYELLPLKNALIGHLGRSPAFMYYPRMGENELDEMHSRRSPRYFTADYDGKHVAFLEVMDGGENFACGDASMRNICGAYCAPEHRGGGVYQNLLNYAIKTLKAEGYARLGVDYESINPTANGFWLKYFSAYTSSVVRRVDDNIFGKQPANAKPEIKPLTKQHLPFLRRLLNRPEILSALHELPTELSVWEKAYKIWSDEGECNFIIYTEEMPAGWLKLNGFDGGGTGWISELAIDPAYWRHGLGSFAVSFAERFFASRGLRRAAIHTNEDNVSARACYESCGYRITERGECTNSDGGHRIGLTYEKEL